MNRTSSNFCDWEESTEKGLEIEAHSKLCCTTGHDISKKKTPETET